MKNFLKKYSLGIVIFVAVVFVAVFLFFLFQRPGDDVYVISVTGRVGIGISTDTSNTVEAKPGMKLSADNIIVTGDRSSCVLAYSKDASNKDNYITVGKNSQVAIYSKNKEGGYNFFLTYGSLISNMPVNESYSTGISTKIFNLDANGSIIKVDYNSDDVIGKVYTFDGNPILRVIQASGNSGAPEKLLKNSVCAVNKQENGAIGFGCLNVAFSLDAFSAQDLKTMSGIANNWTERISYGVNDFEQAFQTAADYAEYTSVVSQITTFEEEPVVTSDTFVVTDDEDVPVTGFVSSGVQAEIEQSTVTTTVPVTEYDETSEMVYSAFTRITLNDLGQYETLEEIPAVTTVPEENEGVVTSRTTVPYDSDDRPNTQTGNSGSNVVTESDAPTVVTQKPVVTTKKTTTTKVTTKKPKPVDPDTEYAVVFTYIEDGEEYWAMQLVRHGESAIAPDVPHIPGRKFVKWDKDFSCVTSDMVVNGIFKDSGEKIEKHTVKLYVESKLWKTIEVEHGKDVRLPYMPIASDSSLVFCGWSESLENVTSDITAFALFIPAD